MSSTMVSSGKQKFDMVQEAYKNDFCGSAQVAEDAHANKYAPIVDPKAEEEKLKATEKLKDKESFSKRHPGLFKALIVAAVLLVVGIIILATLSKVKGVTGKSTATGSKFGDAAIKYTGTLATVGGVVGLAGAGIAAGVTKSKDSSTGDMLDEYRETSMKKAIETHLELQDKHSEVAKTLADANGQTAVEVAYAQGNAIVEAINNGAIPIKSEGIRLSEGFGVHNDSHIHEAVDVYSKYSHKNPSHSNAQFGLDNAKKVIIMDNSNR